MAGELSRREVLKLAGAGLSAAVLTSVLGACAGKPSEQAAPVKYWLQVDTPNPLEVYKARAAAWSPKSNITLDWLQIPMGDLDTKYLSAFATRSNAPDIFNGIVARWAGALNIADVMPDSLAKRMDKDFVEALQPGYKIKGQWFGAGGHWGTVGLGPMLIYNPDDFAEVGLDPTKPPTTMTELLAYARKLVKKDASGNITRSGFAHRYDGALGIGVGSKFIPFLHAFGGRIYNPDTGKCQGVTNADAAVAALTYCTQYTQTEKLSSLTFGVPEQQFGQRKASMMFREGHMIGWLTTNFPGVKFEFAPIPKDQFDGMGITGTDSWAPMVYKWSTNKTNAWKFLDEAFLTPEADLAIAKYMGYVCTFKSNWESDYMKNRKDYKTLQYALAHSSGVMYQHPRTAELTDRHAQGVQEALLGKKSPKEALDSAATDMEAILARTV